MPRRSIKRPRRCGRATPICGCCWSRTSSGRRETMTAKQCSPHGGAKRRNAGRPSRITALRAFIRATIIILVATTAHAEDRYPSRTVKLVVAFEPGGVADIMGRLVAQALQPRLHQSVIVENRPGGDGIIGMATVVRAEPDGYTLLVGGFGGQIIPPLMRDDFPFD